MAISDAITFTSSGNLTAGQLECVQKCMLRWNPTKAAFGEMDDAAIKIAIINYIVTESAKFEKNTALAVAEATSPTDLTT